MDVLTAMDVLRAAAVGDIVTVKRWLTTPHTRHPATIKQVLREAAKYGHNNICQLMLNTGEMPKYDISSALRLTCIHNQQSTAQLLVRHGHIDLNNLTEALLDACVNGHMNIVTWLTSDVMQLSQSDRIKWLYITACARSDMSDIKQLAARIDSDVTCVMSQALRVACHNGRLDAMKWLMSHTTANANSRGTVLEIDGEVTSLMAACNTGRYSIARRLLHCVTPHTVNMMSGKIANTALHFAIIFEADKNCRMQIACGNGDIATVTATLYLSNLDLQVVYDYTALHYACVQGNVEIVRMLLSAFANTYVTNDDRRTPAKLAEIIGYTELLPFLRCTLSDPPDNPALDTSSSSSVPISVLSPSDLPDNPVHVSTNNNSVSISVLSVEDVKLHNSPHTGSKRPGISRQTKRSIKKIV